MSWSLVACIDVNTDGGCTVCGTQSGSIYGVAIRLNGSGEFYATFYDGVTTYDGTPVGLSAGPHILAAVGDGTTLKTYLDGTLVDTAAAAALPAFTDYPFYVGVGSGLDVVIDEVVWWPIALSDVDVADLVLDNTFPSVVAGIGTPTLYWRLGDDPGPGMADASGHGNTGFNLGATLGVTGLLAGDADTAAEFTGGGNYVASDGVFSLGDAPPPPPPAAAAGTRLRLVSMLGSIIDDDVTDGILDKASLDYVEWTLNQADEYAFWFPKHEYAEATIPTWGNDDRVVEIQVWDARPGEPIDPAVDQLFTWGPMVAPTASGLDGTVRATGKGVDTYLFAPPRYIDGQRPNRLDNPSFETGDTSGWTDGGAITSSVTTDGRVEGTYALRVVSSTVFGDIHEHQTITVMGLEIGRLITITGWYKLETFTAPAYAGRGLYAVALEGSVVVAQAVAKIDGTPTTGIWQRAEITIQVPPNKTWDIDVRLYAPDGSTLWDEIQAVEMDSVSTGGEEESLEHLCRVIILHVQDGAVGKSNVYITTDPDADAGPKVAKVWQWADHVPCDTAIREFIDRDDGIDYAMRYNADTGERLFETFYPRRGTDYTTADVHLLFGPGGNLSDYRWHRDGMGTVTVATVLGAGDGPDREEGFYSDPSFIGGLTIESVSTAPQGTAVNSLYPLAKGNVVGANDPPKIIEVDIKDGSLGVPGGALDGITLLRAFVTGDRAPLTIDDGYVQEAASMWRIVKLRFTNANRLLTATLNREPT